MFAKNEKLEAVIGANTEFDGNVRCKGTLRIDGKVTGNIESDWLILGESSAIKGNIKVGGVVIAGNVEGNVNAKELIEIKRKGQIKGDITTTKLVVIEGGTVDGNVTMRKETAKVVELNKDKAASS